MLCLIYVKLFGPMLLSTYSLEIKKDFYPRKYVGIIFQHLSSIIHLAQSSGVVEKVNKKMMRIIWSCDPLVTKEVEYTLMFLSLWSPPDDV